LEITVFQKSKVTQRRSENRKIGDFAGDISTCGVKKKLSNDVYLIALKH